jgi:calcium-dependent protein kinase
MSLVKDGNGQISLDELKEVLQAGSEDDEALKELISLADTNGDGEISFKEFTQMMLKLYQK